MSTPGSNTPERRWRWRWVGIALVIPGVIVNLMNPHQTPGMRMAWRYVMLPLTVVALGYALYADYRGSRKRRDASHGT
jgi:hypothetical protein